MKCNDCGFDYSDTREGIRKLRTVVYVYPNFGLKSILRVRVCPNCGESSITEEKHTGEKGFPLKTSVKPEVTLQSMLTDSLNNWLKKFPEEAKLINKIKKVVE